MPANKRHLRKPKSIGGRSLTDDQNVTIRGLLANELLPAWNNNQSALAPELGVNQTTISAFLKGRQGTGFTVASRICDLLGKDVLEVLGMDGGRRQLRRFNELNGFAQALDQAKSLYPHVPDWIWSLVGGWCPSPEPSTVSPQALYAVTDAIRQSYPSDPRRR